MLLNESIEIKKPFHKITQETAQMNFLLFSILWHINVIKLLSLKMLERPKFIFEQQEERQEQTGEKVMKPARFATEAVFQKSIEVDERRNAERLETEQRNHSSKHQEFSLKKNNLEINDSTLRSPAEIINSSKKINRNDGLKYKQPQTHLLIISDGGSKSSSSANQNQNPQQYQNKINNHLEEAKKMKPNVFFREDNQSPIPQNDQKFTLDPIHYAPTQFDPYKYVGLGKKKSNNKSYQIMLDGESKKKKKPSKNQTTETANQSSFNNSSQIILNQKEDGQHQQHVQVIFEEKEDVVLQYPPEKMINPYNFEIQKVFGKNYFYPDFKIQSAEGQVLVSAQKESCHFNSHYNIFRGDKSNGKIIGYVRGNFGGTEFNVYSKHQNSELVATVCYKAELSCNFTYRKMEVYVKNPSSNKVFTEEAANNKSLKGEFQLGNKTDVIKLLTKEPVWREDLQVYVMNFKGKSKMSSTKNAILMKENSNESVLLFCKQAVNIFYMQVSYPLNLMTSMGILLTSFDFKLLCQ